MQFSKVEGGKRPKTGGRTKGTPNKVSASAKDVIAQAAAELGGAARLLAWAKEDAQNEKAFWATIYPKLLPLQVTGENGGPVAFERIERIIVDPKHTNAEGLRPAIERKPV